MRSVTVDPRFGPELRRLREQSGLTLRQLAEVTRYSHTYLWELETGRKRPGGVDVAERLDVALHSGDTLTTLVNDTVLDPDTAGRIDWVAARPGSVDGSAVDALRTIPGQQRRLDDAIGSAPLIGPTMSHLDIVRRALDATRPPLRTRVLDLAAQWAQFAAWLHMASGQLDPAGVLLDQACGWAAETGDYEMLTTVLSYKGHRAWLAGDVGALIGLTEASLRDTRAYIGQRAYDHYQLARGYALAGDDRATDEALRAGADLAAEAVEHNGPTPAWHYYRTPAFFRLEQGLALQVGGRHAEAIEALTSGLDTLEAGARRAEWVGDYLVHLGLAHAAAGERDKAGAAVMDAASIAEVTQSARLAHRAAELERRGL
ncbi:helix-turn-helix transcriptional regulator [Micromonospora sp. WMMD1102]|uniref:helix-turn-helix domain-containing protein n=1 Tax=Micromonospora sp. WMMD1102 TaxID=3016105 RepID=UPI0024150DCE|nr:helix-turn-helix transcriptional regulator [Micromonospora sp. WMMD1102]MDG4786290.1 helix-turn-helix transcriptional regulator [Micromonospora sp. WMMD1102]